MQLANSCFHDRQPGVLIFQKISVVNLALVVPSVAATVVVVVVVFVAYAAVIAPGWARTVVLSITVVDVVVLVAAVVVATAVVASAAVKGTRFTASLIPVFITTATGCTSPTVTKENDISLLVVSAEKFQR